VTDANVVLGLIRPGARFGQGAIRIDRRLAEETMWRLGDLLGYTAAETAAGVVEVANSNMLRALRLATVQRGIDPRELTLVAFGGAGPLHAARLAATLRIPRVLVPAYSSTLSALGCLTSDLRYDVVQTFRRPLDEIDADRIEALFEGLARTAAESLTQEGYEMSDISIARRADLRYSGQNYEIDVALPPEDAGFDPRLVRERFSERHQALYSYATDEPVECVALRVTALAPGAVLRLPERRPSGSPLLATDHACHLPGVGDVRVNVYSRDGLDVGLTIEGPALIEDEQSTMVVLPGQRARADTIGNLLVEII